MDAEKICAGVKQNIRSQAVTLANAVYAMQAKIEQQIPKYEKMPLAQKVTVGTGEEMIRANPEVQEFRATVRDYAQMLNNLKNILEQNAEPTEVKNLDGIRAKFKVAK